MECTQCKQIKTASKDIKYPCFPCDLCRNLYCIECSELTSTETKCIPLQKRLMKFHCNKCRSYDLVDLLRNTIKDKEVIIEEKDELIKLLQEKLKLLEEKEQMPEIPTYANILTTKHRNDKKNFSSIIIKPKTAQNETKTKKDITEIVNPAELKIGIQNLRTAKNGTVIIKCSTEHENEILETTIKDKLKDNYNIETSKMRKPKIKIANFNEEMTMENIEKCINEQNQLTGVKVTYIKNQKNGLQTIFCECAPKAFKKLIDMKKIYIGWQRYPIYENLDIPRCFQCQEYYHKKANCKNKVACMICGEEHSLTECPKQKKFCVNCANSNKKYKTQHNTNHESTNIDCPTLKYLTEILKNKTDYSPQW